jgi:hypothetical protein
MGLGEEIFYPIAFRVQALEVFRDAGAEFTAGFHFGERECFARRGGSHAEYREDGCECEDAGFHGDEIGLMVKRIDASAENMA